MKYHLTHGNWLQYTVDGEPFGQRKSQYQKFDVQLNPPKENPDPYLYPQYYLVEGGPVPSVHHALLASTSRLLENFQNQEELVVFLSGGLDSEVALHYIWQVNSRQRRLRAVTIQFEGGLNLHETLRAHEICKRHPGVEHEVIRYNVHTMVSSGELGHLSRLYKCSQIAYLTVLRYAAYYPKALVVMGGEVLFQKHWDSDGKSNWYYVYREDEDAATYRYTQLHDHPVVNEFFSYTPALLRSWLKLEGVRDVLHNRVPGKLSLVSSKNRIMHAQLPMEWFPETQAPPKYHGYEKLLYENQAWQEELRADLLLPQEARIPIQKVYRCLNLSY